MWVWSSCSNLWTIYSRVRGYDNLGCYRLRHHPPLALPNNVAFPPAPRQTLGFCTPTRYYSEPILFIEAGHQIPSEWQGRTWPLCGALDLGEGRQGSGWAWGNHKEKRVPINGRRAESGHLIQRKADYDSSQPGMNDSSSARSYPSFPYSPAPVTCNFSLQSRDLHERPSKWFIAITTRFPKLGI